MNDIPIQVVSKKKSSKAFKKSIGIVLIRTNPTSFIQEALMVQTRYTNGFSDFILGRYTYDTVMNLINLMTINERVAICTLDFPRLWTDLIGKDYRREFNEKNQKFKANWMKDGGKALRELLKNARGCGKLHWSFPKGRFKRAHSESELECAVREFSEETNINRNDYAIIHGFQHPVEYKHWGITYSIIYYTAKLTNLCIPDPAEMISLSAGEQTTEIHDIGWFSLEQIRYLEPPICISNTNIVRPIIAYMKKKRKSRIRRMKQNSY